jgi:hypothetical protein
VVRLPVRLVTEAGVAAEHPNKRRTDVMEKSINHNLCQGLRACGIPKEKAYHILNIVEKWDRENGPKWTVGRLKDLRQWYESYLAGKPTPPAWFKHTKDGLPTGVWNWVFKLPKAKALAVLSCSTVFVYDKPSTDQLEKFLHGLDGNGNQDLKALKEMCSCIGKPVLKTHLPKSLSCPPIPTIFDMNGSVPVHDGQKCIYPQGKLGKGMEALELSWDSIPQVTFDFLDRMNWLNYMPMHVFANDFALELEKPHSSIVGRIGCIQNAELKARWIANPNRVTQCTLEPLKELFMRTARNLPTDVTFRQEEGVEWAQGKLSKEIELAGSDLTSASDLLDLECCLYLCDAVYGFSRIDRYQDYAQYFLEVSRGEWFCPQLNKNVSWKQGDPLGTGPSFGLLTLTNNAAGMISCLLAEQDNVLQYPSSRRFHDYFRVVGDDIVMDARIEPYYSQVIQILGGEINFSKTLKSNKVAEFAGRVITPEASYLKKVNYSDPSDNSFMEFARSLGDQAKYFLKPRQRKVYEHLKEVPGIVVNGPWMNDSYGVPFTERYQWYLEEVLPALQREEPDLLVSEYGMELLRAKLSAEESGIAIDIDKIVPFEEGYLPSEVTPSFKSGGDPRLTNGKTLLVVLEKHIEEGHIRSFTEWRSDRATWLALLSSLAHPEERDTEMEISDDHLK